MQIEADQQLAALQQQSQPPHQRDWGNGPMGNVQLFHGHQPNGNLNGARPHDGAAMMSQESPIMEDSPPNQARFAGGHLERMAVIPPLQEAPVQPTHMFCISAFHAVWSEDMNRILRKPSLCIIEPASLLSDDSRWSQTAFHLKARDMCGSGKTAGTRLL